MLVEVDLHGARAVKAAMPESVTVFLAPPTFDELVRRLQSRGTETDAQFARRIETAREEMASCHEFDVVVVNDDLRTVVARLVDLLVGPGSGSAAVQNSAVVPAGAPPITGVPE